MCRIMLTCWLIVVVGRSISRVGRLLNSTIRTYDGFISEHDKEGTAWEANQLQIITSHTAHSMLYMHIKNHISMPINIVLMELPKTKAIMKEFLVKGFPPSLTQTAITIQHVSGLSSLSPLRPLEMRERNSQEIVKS